MAVMHPDNIEDYKNVSEGRKKVYGFIKNAALPHGNFICCCGPSIGNTGEGPDFILIGRKLGIVIIEVKEWGSKQVASCNPQQFTVMISGEAQKITNPDKQAKKYGDALRETLLKYPEFLSENMKHGDTLKIPVGWMVAFPNISRDESLESGFKWFIDSGRILYKDDLQEAGEIYRDPAGKAFLKKFSGCLPFSTGSLTQKEFDKLCFAVWPEVNIELPARSGEGKIKFKREVMRLDESQARLALKLGSGHQIIKGPPGAGKTLILLYRCSHLFKYQPDKKRILFVCYNIALVSYLKRLLKEKNISAGEESVQVLHFFELCSKILGEEVHYENEDRDYYDRVIKRSLEKLRAGESLLEPFDALFADEAQDFDNEMLKVLLNMVKPGGDLVIALDSYQDLYRRETTWKAAGINASGRTHYTRKAYRNTKSLFEFSQKFIGETEKNKNQMSLFPEDTESAGEYPEIKRFKNFGEIETFLTRDISRSIEDEGFKRSEIAVIYDDKVYGQDRFTYDNRALPMRVLNSLESYGIPASWISRDARTKEMYDVTADRVSVVSIHSSKGLDFDLVYLVGIDHIKDSGTSGRSMDSLVYVAMTRAKYRLVIPYIEETGIIRRLKECH